MSVTLIAFDTETSGAFPIGSEIVEFAAVKWRDGQIVDKFQTLLKPSVPMSDFIIKIHGITNQMVQDAPLMKDKISEIHSFLSDGIPLAHHAAFDMGFLAIEFEKHNLPMLSQKVLCTSLLARNVITGTPNHKLQTLIPFLKIKQGTAHRALDDSEACLQVGIHCLQKIECLDDPEKAFAKINCSFKWQDFLVLKSGSDKIKIIVEAIEKKLPMDLIYFGGSTQGQSRRISPVGLVRTPEGDFVQALCHRDNSYKRFYVDKMKDPQLGLV
jgi:DNA polymerase-3 subunit epsilon